MSREENNAALAAKYPAFMAAMERGQRELFEWVRLLETGTAEQVEAEELRRMAVVRADVLKRHVIQILWWEGAAGQEFRRNRALARAAEQKAGAGRRYANNESGYACVTATNSNEG